MHSRAWIGVLLVALVFLVVETAMAGQPPGGPRRGGRGRGRWGAGLAVGDLVADFALKDVEGKTVKLSDFKDKSIVVLEFGACT